MEKQTFKQILILSSLFGVALSLFALLPVVVKIAVFVLMTCVSLAVIILLRRAGALQIFTVKESLWTGALCGFVSYIVFSIIYLPLIYLLSSIFAIDYLGGFVLMLKLSSPGLILMFTIFMSIVSVMFNAFTSMVYFYVTSSIGTFKCPRKARDQERGVNELQSNSRSRKRAF